MKQLNPRMYFNGSQDDKLAMHLLAKAKVPYVPIGPTTLEPTPYLEYGYWRFEGIEGISRFIQGFASGKLPPLDVPLAKR